MNGRRWAALLVVVTLGVLPLVLSASSDEFVDVPAEHLFHDEVGWLAENGITYGCNPPQNDRFCPEDAVIRGQMAAFLVRGLDIPEAGDQGFVDTNGVFSDDVDRLAAAGITFGCNPPENDRFCPDDVVTRGQMAAFLVRGLGLPAAADGGFMDTDGVFADDVNRLAAAGITYGCNPPQNDRFCPDDAVTRGQMAAFLRRGLGEDDGPGTATTTSSSSTSTSTTSTTTSTTVPTSSTTTTSVGTTTTTEPPTTTVPTPGLEVVTTELPDLILFEPYEETLEASGGSGSYHWEVDGLPQGLILDSETGVVSNDPFSPPVIGAGDHLTIEATVTDTANDEWAQGEIEIPVVGGAALASQGAYSTCAMTTEATAYCWGFNGQGQLGDGTTEWSTVPVRVQNPEGTGPLTGIVDLDMRGTQPGHHACALTEEARVYCWGVNNWGELGNPDGFDDGLPRHALPIVVLDPQGESPLEGVTQVAAGDYHTCAVTEDTTALCWGNNEQGQLGNPVVDEGPRPHTLLPVPVMDPTGESPITGIARIDTGNGHTCAMTTEGGVYCWGLSNGGLGDGETTQSDLPVRVMSPDGTESLGDVIDITVGNFHSCALLSDGTAKCWGGNLDGQLGNPSFPDGSPLPVEVRDSDDNGALTGIDQLSAGTWHTCARIDDTARCWGSNNYGKLGNGATEGTSLPVSVLNPEGTADFAGITEIEAGQNHTCAITDDGATYCWGLNLHAQLGNGERDTLPPSPNPLPIPVHPMPAVIPSPDITTSTLPAVQVFEAYAMQLEAEGGEPPYEWQVDGLPQGMVATETGSITRDPESPILDSAETVELTVTVTDAAGGTDVAHLNLDVVGVSDISTGQDHTCAVTSDSALYCWGRNGAGQLGDGTTEDRHLPTPVADPNDPEGTFDGVTAVSTSQAHTCAITVDTTLYCWGYNGAGRLGLGSEGIQSFTTPQQVIASDGEDGHLSGVTAVATGGLHTCAITSDGHLQCWGDNFRGQIGRPGQIGGNPTTVFFPGTEDPFEDVTSVGTGSFHTCITTSDDPTYCWGWNQAGQLGVGSTVPIQSTTPLVVGGDEQPFEGLLTLDSGTFHNCGVTSDDQGWCWGLNNHGQLGDGNGPENALTPAPIADPTDPTSPLQGLSEVSTGIIHTCARMIDGTALCWGDNEVGSLGDGTTNDSDVPVGVVDPDTGTPPFTVDAIEGGQWQTCAVVSGIPWCWGHNEYGQLGDGTTTDRHAPVPVMPRT